MRGGGCFLGGARPREKAAEGTPPGSRSWKSWLTAFAFPVSQLPLPKGSKKKKKKITSTLLLRNRVGGGVRGQHALPSKPSTFAPAPRYLNETETKVVLLWFPRGRGSPDSWTGSWHPVEPPISNEKLLVGVFRVQAVGRLLRELRSRRRSPPAAGRAPCLHSASGGLARRQPRRPESPSRGAGQTMELGAGPAGASRPRRKPTVAGAELAREVRKAHPLEGEVTLLRFRSADFVSPPKAAAAGAAPSTPLAINHRRQSTELGKGWVGGWVWGSYVYQPGSSIFLC